MGREANNCIWSRETQQCCTERDISRKLRGTLYDVKNTQAHLMSIWKNCCFNFQIVVELT